MAEKFFIGGLSFSTSSERLREVFGQAGAVQSVEVVKDRDTGRSRGFGFVEMATTEEAEAAVKKFNGHEVDGRRLTVQPAKPASLGDRSAIVEFSAGESGKRVQVAAVSTPQDQSRWRWRIVNYAGEVVEESRQTFATIASAIEHGTERLKQMNMIDNSISSLPRRSTRHLRLPQRKS
jgi:cold-inducible RNA-binding protein